MDINALTYGIEIECLVPATAMDAAGWVVGAYHHGAAVPGFAGWNLQRDGSIAPEVGFVNVEVVSGILSGADGLAAVAAMVAKLNDMGAKVNRSTGFHVHVGFNAGDAEALCRLIHLVAHVEPALRASTGSAFRDDSSYCKSVKSNFTAVKGQKRVTYSTSRNIADRYMVLNVSNYLGGARPTVEFRVFAGTTNIDKINGYIQICLGLVQKAIEVPVAAKWDARPVSNWIKSSNGGLYQGELFRLFQVLGWKSNFGQTPRGILNAASIKPAMAILRKMASKYDAAKGTAIARREVVAA